MSKVYFISDLHYNHKNMAERRGFKNVEKHNEHLIKSWNTVVAKRDKVFILGDITMEKKDYRFLNKLNGRKVVVLGNHDLPQHTKEMLKYVDQIAGVINYKGYILTHVPIHESELTERFRGNIHGHLHEGIIKDHRYVNVCVEMTSFKPKTLEELNAYRDWKYDALKQINEKN